MTLNQEQCSRIYHGCHGCIANVHLTGRQVGRVDNESTCMISEYVACISLRVVIILINSVYRFVGLR